MGSIEKQLRNLPPKDQKRVFDAIGKLFEREFEGLDIKKLKGYEDIFRVRVGNYRIIYYNDGIHILLKAIRKRDESTYKDF